MTPPQEPRTGGVAVWRCSRCFELTGESLWFMSPNETCAYPHDPYTAHAEPFRAFPLAEAEALEAVEVAASIGRRDGWGAQAQYDMARALSVLHNLRNAALRRKS